MADRTESVILDFEVDMEDSIESIESLTKANKELREERKKVNLQSAEGQKRVAEINAQLDKNTDKIKNNVSALEKQKLNIGNYKSALDGIIPGLGGFIDKTVSGTKAVQGLTLAQKLLLGPIGLIILALTAIIKWLTGSEEGMDKLAIIMAKVGAIVNVVTDRLIQLGGALVKFLSGDLSGGIDGIKNSFSGMGDEMTREIALAEDLAQRLDILDELNLALNVRLSEQQNLIKNLIIQSKNRTLSEEERMNKLVEAARIEKQLTGEQIALRVAEINILASELQQRNNLREAAQKEGETTIDFAKRLIANQGILFSERKKLSEQLDQYNGLLGNQANVQEKIQNQQDAISDKIAENLKAAQELADAERRIGSGREVVTEDPLIDAFKTRVNVITDLDKRLQEDLVKRNKESDDEILRNKAKRAEMERDIEAKKFDIIMGLSSATAGLMKEDSEAQRAITSAMTLVNTYAAAMAAYKSGAEINVFFGIAAAAAAVAAGLANVARINNVEFAEGGWTGPGGKWDAVGVVHADEYVTPKRVVNNPMAKPHLAALERMRLTPYADGGLVANGITGPINQQMEIMNIVKNLPPVVASWSEGRKVGRRIEFKEKISKR